MKRLLTLWVMMMFITTAYSQNIINAEYFVDVDPGCGNGTPITIPLPGGTVNFPVSVPLNSLGGGFHSLAIRVRNADGTWSFSERRGFFIYTSSSNTGNITAAEYFFDTDPGAGKAISIPVGIASGTINLAPVIPTSLSAGFHFLAIRTRDI